MHGIDGSAGGGQIVRTAVTLSALLGEPVRIEDVRGDRPTPGIRPQHAAAVEAAATLCDATVEGAELESDRLVFEPGDVRAVDAVVDVGTAGSVSLVLDTVLPLATALDEPATVTVRGGTDVQWSPPVDYLRRVKLPLLAAAGLNADLSVDARGFYPVGGGEVTLSLSPSDLGPLDLDERSSLHRLEVYSTADASLEEAEVAERQASAAVEGVTEGAGEGAGERAGERVGVDAPAGTDARYVDADSAGSALVAVAVYEGSRTGFSALGEAGKPSEAVAEEAVGAFRRFHDGPAAVDRHMADQLMVPLALGGGAVLAPEATDHVETNCAVIETFGYQVDLEERDGGVLLSCER